ncbi:MAG: hypothetical protein AAGB03_11230, partial [Pseudomonadota bacterium]
ARTLPILQHSERTIYAVLSKGLFDASLQEVIEAGLAPQRAQAWVTAQTGDVFLTEQRSSAADLQFFIDARRDVETGRILGANQLAGVSVFYHQPSEGERLLVAEAPLGDLPLRFSYAMPVAHGLGLWSGEMFVVLGSLGLLAALSGATLLFLADRSGRYRHRAEQALFLNRIFSQAECAARAGSWYWDGTEGCLYASPGLMRWLGYEARAQLLDLNDLQALLHPDDRKLAHKTLEALKAGRRRVSVD